MVTKKQFMRRQFRAYRAAADLSQIDVARALGVTERRYWLIENGYADATPDETKSLAKLFKVQPDQLEALAS